MSDSNISRDDDELEVEVGGHPQVRIKPGEYWAHCHTVRIERNRQYGRWQCILLWDVALLDDETVVTVPMWLPLGNGPKARMSPTSKFLSVWTSANGGNEPGRGDRPSAKIFRDRTAKVVVGFNTKDYSVVKDVLSWKPSVLPSLARKPAPAEALGPVQAEGRRLKGRRVKAEKEQEPTEEEQEPEQEVGSLKSPAWEELGFSAHVPSKLPYKASVCPECGKLTVSHFDDGSARCDHCGRLVSPPRETSAT